MPTHYLACDLGADSGRLMLGTLDQGKIVLEELHRFPNGPVKAAGGLHWNIDGLFNELKTGLKKAAARRLPISSISTDSWGVDYVLYDQGGQILPPVWHYRDARTAAGRGKRQGARGLADDLRRDRHPVHGVEHDLPAGGRTARPPGRREAAIAHRRRVQSLLLRRGQETRFRSPAPRSFTIRRPGRGRRNFFTRSACARNCLRPSVRPAHGWGR